MHCCLIKYISPKTKQKKNHYKTKRLWNENANAKSEKSWAQEVNALSKAGDLVLQKCFQ